MTRVRTVVLYSLAAAAVVVLLLWPRITDFYSYNAVYYNSVVASAAIAAILTISLNLCMGYGGLLSMMQTGLQLVGGYAVAVTVTKAGWSWLIGLGLAIVAGVLVSVVVLVVSLRATYLYFGMITLAADLILVEAGRDWESLTHGVVGISGVAPPMSKTAFYYVVLGALAAAFVFQRNLVRSGHGRAAMAVRESGDTASAMGIRPATTKMKIFGISGGIGGLAGGLYALQLGFINPDVGLLDNGLIFFVGLFVGGIGTLVGPVLGVGLIAFVLEMIRSQARYSTIILGLVLLAAMMVIPSGIVGTWRSSRLGRDPVDDAGPDEEAGRVPASVASVEAPPGVAALDGTAVVKHFGGVRAVDGVDIRIMPGTIHGIIGPNGSGKSTLVACLTRFLHLDEGTVRVFGEPAPRRPDAVARTGVTRVFQAPHLFERLSVLDNVLTGMRSRERYSWVGAVLRSPAYRRQSRAGHADAVELLGFAGLASRARWPASALSHGQKRLLEVVRAVATRPRVLILDEPATGLTPAELRALATMCRALRERGLAVVVIEHNVEFVMDLCDEITVLESGRVIERGKPAEVRSSPAVLEAYLGRPDLVVDAP
jgi:ABC-type branched-subunit amino acid transport system ATPase component/ABC-type branched-subunit amino acid transport system permease subunit